MILEIAIGFIAALPVCLATHVYFRFVGHNRDQKRLYTQHFFDLSQHAAEQEPDAGRLLEKLECFAALIQHPGAYSALLTAIRQVEQKLSTGTLPSHPRLSPLEAHIFYNWAMAVSYQRPIMGIYLRAKLSKVLDPETEKRTVVEDHIMNAHWQPA